MLEAFDAEVVRAVFATNRFDFSKHVRARRMPPDCLRMLLVAKVVNPSMNNKGDFLRSVVSQVTDRLLEAAPTDGTEEQRLQYVHNLCDAAAHHFSPAHVGKALEMLPKMDEGCYEPAEDLVSAAAAVGDIAKMRDLISESFLLHMESKIFGYASANAARVGNQEMLAMILECDIKDTVQESRNGSVSASLSAACGAGQRHIVEYMLALPSDGDLQDKRYEHAFEAAAGSGYGDILMLLLNKIPAAARQKVMFDSLHKACANGHVQTVEFLLDSGADMNLFADHGGPLHCASLFGHTRVVRLLLDRGAMYYKSMIGDPLYFAAINGHTQVAQMLLDSGASIHAKGYWSVLARAAMNGEAAMVRFLLENGIDVKDHGNGNIALEKAAERGQEEVVKILLAQGIDIDGGNEDRDPPVLRAMIYGHQHMVKVLLKHGAKDIDPLETDHAEHFRNGRYPPCGKM